MYSLIHFIFVSLLGNGMNGAGSWDEAFREKTKVTKEITSKTRLIYVLEYDRRLVVASSDESELRSFARNNGLKGTLMPRHEHIKHIELIQQRDKWLG